MHRIISAEYSADKKYNNTKKIGRQSIIHFDADLNSVKSELSA